MFKCIVTDVLKIVLLADDTNVFFEPDYGRAKQILNNELEKLSEWFKTNRLSLNIKKLVIDQSAQNVGKFRKQRRR